MVDETRRSGRSERGESGSLSLVVLVDRDLRAAETEHKVPSEVNNHSHVFALLQASPTERERRETQILTNHRATQETLPSAQ